MCVCVRVCVLPALFSFPSSHRAPNPKHWCTRGLMHYLYVRSFQFQSTTGSVRNIMLFLSSPSCSPPRLARLGASSPVATHAVIMMMGFLERRPLLKGALGAYSTEAKGKDGAVFAKGDLYLQSRTSWRSCFTAHAGWSVSASAIQCGGSLRLKTPLVLCSSCVVPVMGYRGHRSHDQSLCSEPTLAITD